MRSFGDSDATRKAIYDNVLKAAQDIQPVANNRYSLELNEPHWSSDEGVSINERKRAILRGETLNRRLRGTWRLKDVQGNLVSERLATVAHVPRMTNQGTFVVNGSEYTLGHQMRLRPGVFTRRKENGELESHINIMPGKGLSHHYFLEPETGIFKIRVGQANMPLVSVMKAMGATDSELRDAWGAELHGLNAQKDDPRVMDKLYARLIGKKGDPNASLEDKRQAVGKAFSEMELDPEVTKRTLGQPYGRLGKEVAIATTKKLLGVSRGEADTDDRDALAFQHFMGPEDLFAERIGRDKRVLNELLWKATTHGNLDKMPTGAFTRHIHAALLDSGLGQCFDVETKVLTARGFIAWPVVTEDDLFACLINGKLSYHKAYKLFKYEYDGQLYCRTTKRLDYCVTPNHRLWCKSKFYSDYQTELAEQAHGKTRIFNIALPPYDGVDTDFVLPSVKTGRWQNDTGPLTTPGDIWASFLGWYISEGWVSTETQRNGNETRRICISQCPVAHPVEHAEIIRVLSQLPCKWNYNHSNKTFCINNKQFVEEVAKYGSNARVKRIPRYCFSWTNRRLALLLDAYMAGDGNVCNGHHKAETVSEQLAEDLSEAFNRLGNAVYISKRKLSEKNPAWADSYVVSVLKTGSTTAFGHTCHKRHYVGPVYCAHVPGERLYISRNRRNSWSANSLEEINPADVFDQQTRVSRLGYGGIPSIDAVPDEARSVQPSHLGYIDLLRTPESFKVGVDSRVSHVAKKGSDGRIYTPFLDPKSGQMVYRSPQDVADLTLAFPGELQKGKPLVAAIVGGKTRYVPRDQVDLAMPHAEHWFSPINNMVPMKSAVKGQRAAMASRFLTQALPIKDAESPHVRGQVPGAVGRSFEEHYGNQVGAVFGEQQSGRVTSVSPDEITVKYADGSTKTHELYNNFPYNRKTYIHNESLVQKGDPVKPGQLLAKSNYTDQHGHVALGKNLRVAYVPFRGLNYEDAYVISESGAKKLSSEHMYQHAMEWDERHRRGLNSFISIFPGTFQKPQLRGMDTDGIVKPGTVLKPGDPVVLAARERELSRKQVHTSHKGSFINDSLTWDHHAEGMVTDVEKTDKGVTVAVKSLNQLQVGDKMSGRYGDKGVIADVIPDDQMPHDEEGNPYEVLANPLGVISRTNPAQMIEATLGAIAAKTGKYYAIDDFSNIKDLTEYAMKEREKHGLNNFGKIFDPTTNKSIDNVFTGNRFFMKLHHTSESKGQGRGLGGYTAEGMPAKGGVEGSKRMALMDVNAMLSHGAVETLRDVKLIRGQKNQEYWSNFMQGNRPPTPRVPIVYEKFVNYLKASGVNVVRKGTQTHLMELTDKNVDDMAGDRELQNVKTVDWKTGLTPIKGGLFDETLTGGHNGNRWAKITLHEPMPNPVMEEPIRRLLGLTKEKFEKVIAGSDQLGGKTGPEAIQSALAGVNVKQALAQCQADIKSGRKTLRDIAVRKLQFLKSAEMKGIHPKDWMMTKVPVIPPMFRPISVMQQSGGRIISDSNYLYKELFDANQALKDVKGVSEDIGDERLNLYNAYRGVTGLGDPVHPKLQEKKIKGFLQHVFGTSPKFSTVQQKLIGTTVDLVGRAVVVPNPDLHMDEVGLPEARAWEIYTPFIARRLVKQGVPRVQALEHVRNKHDLAKRAMLEEINERPVIVTRAPTLHRYGLMSFWPRLTKGETLQISPIVVGGFNMDFDGDASNYHVPASDEARNEAVDKLMPSKNLFNVSRFQAHYLLRQEYIGGVYNATAKKNDKPSRVFATKQDALRAFYNGSLQPADPIHIVGDK
jgi:DNA-directed RNA polymerase beta subunit